jgi:hypothetical protein
MNEYPINLLSLRLILTQKGRSVLAWGLGIHYRIMLRSDGSAMGGCERRTTKSRFVVLVNCHCCLRSGFDGAKDSLYA